MAAAPNTRRVVITGLGVISPIGADLDTFWQSLTAGRSGVERLVSLPPDALPTSFAGEVRDFTGVIDDFGPLPADQKKAVRKGIKLMSRECQMGVAAALKAWGHAQIDASRLNPDRVGVVYGSDYMLSPPQEFNEGIDLCAGDERRFQFGRWGREGMGKMNPLWLLKYLPNMPACHIAIYLDLRGPNNSITQREASANFAIWEAYQTILRGGADVLITGATGTRVHLMKTLHALQQEEIAGNGAVPATASRPFDRNRTGMVLGEGAGAIVLEELETALTRGATIYGEVLAGASSSVADPNLVARRDTALANAMRLTLQRAGVRPADVGHIAAHGLGTRSSDADEARAIREVFGPSADEVPVTAPKSYFGNLGAGGGIVELVASVLALKHAQLPPILNFETPDPQCPIRVATAGVSPGRSFLKLSVTPQGQASSVLVGAYQ